jgi:4-alpha-glucanotransferase
MLHGPFGIGVLGDEAYQFVDFLKAGGFRAWQILPVERTGAGFSPYSGVSSFAGEPMLIDPRLFLDMGLISQEELIERARGMDTHSVNYELVLEKQQKLLRLAFSRIKEEPSFEKPYLRYNPFWLSDYALYMVLKRRYDQKPWYEWFDADLRKRNPQALKRAAAEYSDEIEYHSFVQWIFNRQWTKLKKYCAQNEISIVGDMPFYVSADSAEVWSSRELFDADENGKVPAVGGAPPDYFTTEGQCWGNPVYNWKLMKQEGYRWWISRIEEALKRYDIMRLDHFRGFESYWSIPSETMDARDGVWKNGPRLSFFRELKRALGDVPIIAEDLGDIDEPVERLLEKSEYRGMSVLQFGFLGDTRHLPHMMTEKKIAYTGTHDNTTLLAWMHEMWQPEREKALFYLGFEGDWTKGGPNCEINKAWIRVLYLSGASLVIVPIQDLLGYGADTRTNIPGTPQGNWRFRIAEEALWQIDTGFYNALCRIAERDNSALEHIGEAQQPNT